MKLISRYSIPVLAEEKTAFNLKVSLAAVSVTCVCYGMQFVLCIICLRRLWIHTPRTPFVRFLFCYTLFLGIVNTVWMVTAPSSLQLYAIEWLQDCRPVSGVIPPDSCPSELLNSYKMDTWLVDTTSVVSYVACTLSADALLLWRCRQIWISTMSPYANSILIVPCLLLLGSTASSVYFFPEAFQLLNYIYLAISLSLNILLTWLIIGRLTFCKRRVRKVFGDAKVKHYSFVSAMFIESAASNAIVSVLMIATAAANNALFQICYALSPTVQGRISYIVYVCLSSRVMFLQACANYFIIYRGLRGIQASWGDSSLSEQMTSIEFARPNNSNMESSPDLKRSISAPPSFHTAQDILVAESNNPDERNSGDKCDTVAPNVIPV
ncbi:unnamed protein product [Somion occarium]|uniref:Uncharacterized protein n=1 Tax=Somion occarium TaxID=3059160 RepID=A0ABP1D532_9APHY